MVTEKQINPGGPPCGHNHRCSCPTPTVSKERLDRLYEEARALAEQVRKDREA